jgi:kynurenine formamidase
VRHRLVDLSHSVEDDMVTYPGLPGPRVGDHLGREESRDHYAPGTEFQIGRIEMVANTGTYLDTPFHRDADGHDLADLPLDAVAGVPGIVVDPPARVVHASDLDGLDLRDSAVLVRTGWSKRWRTPRYGAVDHPHLDAGAVAHLVRERPRLVGIDSVNIDGTADGERPAHTLLLRAGIYIVEHLTALDALGAPAPEFEFFAVPVKVRGMGSFPVRAFARMAA